MRFLVPLGSLLALGLLGAACGSSAGGSLFGGASASGTGAAGGAGATSSSVGEGGGTTTASSVASTAVASSTTSGPVTATGAGGGGPATATSASTGAGGDVTVWCQNAECAAGQVCCFHQQDPSQDHCSDTADCGDGFILITCNDPTDCPNGVCCGDFNGNGYDGVACQPTCIGPNDIVMCQDDPSVCGPTETCNQSGYLGTGYMFCQ